MLEALRNLNDTFTNKTTNQSAATNIECPSNYIQNYGFIAINVWVALVILLVICALWRYITKYCWSNEKELIDDKADEETLKRDLNPETQSPEKSQTVKTLLSTVENPVVPPQMKTIQMNQMTVAKVPITNQVLTQNAHQPRNFQTLLPPDYEKTSTVPISNLLTPIAIPVSGPNQIQIPHPIATRNPSIASTAVNRNDPSASNIPKPIPMGHIRRHESTGTNYYKQIVKGKRPVASISQYLMLFRKKKNVKKQHNVNKNIKSPPTSAEKKYALKKNPDFKPK